MILTCIGREKTRKNIEGYRRINQLAKEALCTQFSSKQKLDIARKALEGKAMDDGIKVK